MKHLITIFVLCTTISATAQWGFNPANVAGIRSSLNMASDGEAPVLRQFNPYNLTSHPNAFYLTNRDVMIGSDIGSTNKSDAITVLVESATAIGNSVSETSFEGEGSLLANIQNAGTDDQNISGSGLEGSMLTIGIEGGTSEIVDLAPLLENLQAQISAQQDLIDDLTARMLIREDCACEAIEPTHPNITIMPNSISEILAAGTTKQVFYQIDSDDGSLLPTPAAMRVIDTTTGDDAIWAFTTSAANQAFPYEVILDATNLTPGTYSATLIAGPVTGYSDGSIPISLTVAAPAILSITDLELIDAVNDVSLGALSDGMIINMNDLPVLNLDVRAIATSDVGSVKFRLSGEKSITRTENVVPYALYGDDNSDYVGSNFTAGSYYLTVTPYSEDFLSGAVGSALTISFHLIDTFNKSETIKSPEEIGEVPNKTKIKVYPNPVTNKIFIEISYLNSKEANISLFSATGQLVNKIDLKGEYNNLQEIDLDGLSEGLYILKVFDKEERVLKTSRVIVQKN